MPRRGRPNVTLRLDEKVWEAFGSVAPDRSAILRAFIHWFIAQDHETQEWVRHVVEGMDS